MAAHTDADHRNLGHAVIVLDLDRFGGAYPATLGEVADALADRGVNCIVQRVAAREGDARLSLSSNTDLTTDTLAALARAGCAASRRPA